MFKTDDFANTEISVSDLTNQIKHTLSSNFNNLNILGEVSNFRPSSIGHWYFTLKDSNASISAVMFKGNTRRMQPLKDGDQICVSGSLDVYAPRGSYQIICSSINFVGLGNILAQLEERKKAYEKAGWFDTKYKKQISKIPNKLGIVTSPTTAALQDALQVLHRRAPSLDVIIIPAVVQGDGAAKTIARAIELANKYMLCDQLIITRGGGSIEDLLPFSDDLVLKAILISKIPVISGVGHEIDWALSDFVADLRAPTPSAAAELASSGIFETIEKNKELSFNITHSIKSKISFISEKTNRFDKNMLQSLIRSKIDSYLFKLANSESDIERSLDGRIENLSKQNTLYKSDINREIDNKYLSIKYHYKEIQNSIARDVDSKISDGKLYISNINNNIVNGIEKRIYQNEYIINSNFKNLISLFENKIKEINTKNNDLKNLYSYKIDNKYNSFQSRFLLTTTEIKALSPNSILKRGYSIVEDKNGVIISSIKQISHDELLAIKVKDGSIKVKVE
ncbi:MAG: exodeoxyribonuclease VII large subunit [Spirochaetaceae bacterium]|nr:exodeoxyribonuclease VII large subunit [Spirochaetaceae bacterium]